MARSYKRIGPYIDSAADLEFGAEFVRNRWVAGIGVELRPCAAKLLVQLVKVSDENLVCADARSHQGWMVMFG